MGLLDFKYSNLKKNIILSVFFQGISTMLGLLVVPLCLRLFTEMEYGIWLTIFSFITWMRVLDLGIGHGLRNKLSALIAENNIDRANGLIELSYGIVGAFVFVLGGGIALVGAFTNLNAHFDVEIQPGLNLNLLFVVAASLFCFQIIGNLVNGLLHSLQLSRLVVLIELLTKIILVASLLSLFVLKDPPVIWLIYLNLVPKLFITFFLTIYAFRTLKKRHGVQPRWGNAFKAKELKGYLLNSDFIKLPFGFFLIDLFTVFSIQSLNYFIASAISPEDLLSFNLTYRLFSVVLLLFYMYLAPFWNQYILISVNKDFILGRKLFRKMLLGYGLFCMLNLIVVFTAPWIVKLWTENKVSLSSDTLIATFVLICLVGFNSLLSHVLNGFSKLKLQILTSIILCTITVLFATVINERLQMTEAGIIMGAIIGFSLAIIILGQKTYKILKQA